MQSMAAPSDALVTRVGQWRRSAVVGGHLLLPNAAMPRQLPNFRCSSAQAIRNRGNIHAAYTSMIAAPKNLTLLDFSIENLRTDQCFEVNLQVQDYELDQYGGLYNTVYSSYCERGHHEFFKRVGVNLDAVAQTDEKITFSDLSLKLFSPLESGDKFIVKTRVSCISTTRIFIDDFIFKMPDCELVLEANTIAVWLDRSNIPIPIQPGLRAKLLELDFFSDFESF